MGYRRQLSAKRRTVDFTLSVRLLMWQTKMSGPRTVPSGTLESTIVSFDEVTSITTLIFRCVRKFVIQVWRGPWIPYS